MCSGEAQQLLLSQGFNACFWKNGYYRFRLEEQLLQCAGIHKDGSQYNREHAKQRYPGHGLVIEQEAYPDGNRRRDIQPGGWKNRIRLGDEPVEQGMSDHGADNSQVEQGTCSLE